ncbi:MAG: 23S rRNA (pseudouridine(1915)-N(3))-methyltransferase RlmH [Wenzhouxiangella sp.]|jgi:23S rRNA (pseudouridine1915-N3)-methyltransferase|nr:23S rRNA (pseudouridine(1915)-N(3))-methyltransferase RlmH [Wenzhouxiangella sp.]
MKLVVAAVGQRMPGWIEAGWKEYARRFPPHLSLELVEVPVAGRAGADRASELEAERLSARAPERAERVALHGARQAWSTEELAQRLAGWMQRGDPVWFFVGGADGLAPSLLESCRARWSLGPAVYPHMLVRVIIAEQIYRAASLLSGHPYHRA